MDLVQAMAKVEGFGASPNNRPTRNNNPGDVEYHDWMTHKYKLLGSDGRFAIFITPDEGYKCMADILAGPSYRNLTLEQIITRWNEGNIGKKPMSQSTRDYLNLVCKFTGLKPTDIPGKEIAEIELAYNKDKASQMGIVKPEFRSVIG